MMEQINPGVLCQLLLEPPSSLNSCLLGTQTPQSKSLHPGTAGNVRSLLCAYLFPIPRLCSARLWHPELVSLHRAEQLQLISMWFSLQH